MEQQPMSLQQHPAPPPPQFPWGVLADVSLSHSAEQLGSVRIPASQEPPRSEAGAYGPAAPMGGESFLTLPHDGAGNSAWLAQQPADIWQRPGSTQSQPAAQPSRISDGASLESGPASSWQPAPTIRQNMQPDATLEQKVCGFEQPGAKPQEASSRPGQPEHLASDPASPSGGIHQLAAMAKTGNASASGPGRATLMHNAVSGDGASREWWPKGPEADNVPRAIHAHQPAQAVPQVAPHTSFQEQQPPGGWSLEWPLRSSQGPSSSAVSQPGQDDCSRPAGGSQRELLRPVLQAAPVNPTMSARPMPAPAALIALQQKGPSLASWQPRNEHAGEQLQEAEPSRSASHASPSTQSQVSPAYLEGRPQPADRQPARPTPPDEPMRATASDGRPALMDSCSLGAARPVAQVPSRPESPHSVSSSSSSTPAPGTQPSIGNQQQSAGAAAMRANPADSGHRSLSSIHLSRNSLHTPVAMESSVEQQVQDLQAQPSARPLPGQTTAGGAGSPSSTANPLSPLASRPGNPSPALSRPQSPPPAPLGSEAGPSSACAPSQGRPPSSLSSPKPSQGAYGGAGSAPEEVISSPDCHGAPEPTRVFVNDAFPIPRNGSARQVSSTDDISSSPASQDASRAGDHLAGEGMTRQKRVDPGPAGHPLGSSSNTAPGSALLLPPDGTASAPMMERPSSCGGAVAGAGRQQPSTSSGATSQLPASCYNNASPSLGPPQQQSTARVVNSEAPIAMPARQHDARPNVATADNGGSQAPNGLPGKLHPAVSQLGRSFRGPAEGGGPPSPPRVPQEVGRGAPAAERAALQQQELHEANRGVAQDLGAELRQPQVSSGALKTTMETPLC